VADATKVVGGRERAVRVPRALVALDAVTQFCNVCGSLLIFALMALIVVDVLGRNLAGAPLPGVPEMVALSIVAIVFLQSPQTLRAGRMPRSEALLSVLARRAPTASTWLLDLHDLAGLATAAIVCHASWPPLVKAWSRDTFVGAVGDFTAPVWPVKATIVVGAALLAMQFAARIARRHLAGTVKGCDGRDGETPA